MNRKAPSLSLCILSFSVAAGAQSNVSSSSSAPILPPIYAASTLTASSARAAMPLAVTQPMLDQSPAPSSTPVLSPTLASSNSPVGISVYDRTRIDTWQWFEAPPSSETYAYTQTLLRIAVMQKIKQWDWEAELSQPSILGLPTDAVRSAPQGQIGLGGTYYASNANDNYPAAAFLKQGFIRYHFEGLDRSIRIGRVEFNDGLETTPKNKSVAWLQANRIAARLIGNFGFANAQRSLDGVDARYNVGDYHVIVLAARADQCCYNMNGTPELNVDIQYGAITHPFSRGRGLWRAFAIGYHDGRTGIVKTDNRPLAVRQQDHQNVRLGTYGGDLIWTAPVAHGTFDFVAWGALQNGQWGTLNQSASAGAIEAGYAFDKLRLRPWLRAGEYRSSGDDNPADGTNHTFNQLLPTPRVYARDPFFNSMDLNNQFVQAILRPNPKVNVRSDLHWLQLSNAHDLWYSGGGAFDNKVFGFTGRPSGGHTSFASLYDISADWAVAKQFDMNFYYAHVWGKSVIGAIYPRDRNSNFGYVEFVYHWGIPQKTN